MPAAKSFTLQESFAACLHEVDEVVVEVKHMIEGTRRIDDLLKTIGVAHGRTREETIELQNEHAQERQEYQALQDAYRLTQRRISAVFCPRSAMSCRGLSNDRTDLG